MQRIFLQNASLQKYRQYIKLLPDLRQKKARDYTVLILTLLAGTFFAIFAINPTLSTISKLRRELVDSKFAEKSLSEKIVNLSHLLEQQTTLSSDIPIVLSAIPENPDATLLLAQLQTIAKTNNVQISDLQTYEVPLTSDKKEKITPSYDFSVNVQGDEQALMAFLTNLTAFNRLVTIHSINYDSTTKIAKTLSIKGKAYFIPTNP